MGYKYSNYFYTEPLPIMKLFAAAIALAKAQDEVVDAGDDARTFSFGDSAYSFGDYGASFDSGNFYDSAYGSDYAELSASYNYDDAAAAADAAANDGAVADEAGRDKDEARYFGQAINTVTTTTVTTTPGTTHPAVGYCIKCDVMDVSTCVASSTNIEACAHGDVCFLEARRNKPRTGTVLTQLCTDLKAQNMVASSTTPRTMLQCFPTFHLLNTGHRLGEMASICRTCFVPSATNFDSVTAANNEEVFLKGLSATTLEIPQDGNKGGASAMSVNLQHEDATTATTNFAIIWFSAPHGLTVADHGLNFALTY